MIKNILKTYTSPLNTLRLHGPDDVSPLDIATEGDYGNKPPTAIKVNDDKDSSYTNAIQIQMSGSTEGTTFTWLLYGWRKNNGMATLMCKGTAIIGSMDVVILPSTVGPALKANDATNFKYVHTLVIDSNDFVKPFFVTDSGNNRAAILSGDLCGFTDLYLEIQDSTNDVNAYLAGW